MKKSCTLILFLLTLGFLQAQPVNDNCDNAILLDNVTSFCSEIGEFTNLDATDSGYGIASCWGASSTDVWFVFTAFATDVVITVIGETFGSPGGTLELPQVALYRGVCGGTINELRCGRDLALSNIIEINRGGLVAGQEYFIRIDGTNDMNGSFQLCINNFNPPVDPGQDCVTGSVLCDKSPFSIEQVSGAGADPDEAVNSCLGGLGGNSEQQSTWYRWTAANDGSLSFTINPNNPSDDLDFVLFELPTAIDVCSDKVVLRCMATACEGPTGLNDSSTDLEEDLNCDPGEDGFVQSILMQQGVSYALMINNFSTTGNGYSISWGGDGEFLGPDAAFDIAPDAGLRCEEEFIVTDLSTFDNGTIVAWTWNFGAEASPQTATGPGPHAVTYGSIGTKFIVLTIESDIGCLVTEVRQLEAEPCCEDLDDLNVEIVDFMDIPCAGQEVGEVTVGANGGTPGYEYSFGGADFREIIRYTDLASGSYELIAIDAHGCQDTTNVTISEPDPIIIDLGPDQLVNLGEFTTINPSIDPPENYDFQWCPTAGIVDTTILNIEVQPPGETTYVLKVTNDSGCTAQDSVTLRVNTDRPIYLPNVFSPNGDGLNDQFTVYGTVAVDAIESLKVFDRWGNLVFHSQNVPIGDTSFGWDGNFKGQPCNPAVFTAVAKIRFIDNQTIVFGGDLTLIR